MPRHGGYCDYCRNWIDFAKEDGEWVQCPHCGETCHVERKKNPLEKGRFG